MLTKAITGTAASQTLTGTLTLTIADIEANPIQVIDPDGARIVILPAENLSKGRIFLLRNAAGGAEIITINDDGGSAVCTPTQNETALLFCDGTTWRGLVGFHN